MAMRRASDVIVVGGGIVGAAVAHELAGAGLDVCVIDAALPAATAAGMGHLVLMDEDAAEFALGLDSMRRWQALAPRLDAACAWQRCGTLWLAEDAAQLDAARAKQQRLHAQQQPVELLDAAALAAAEPALRPGLAGALRVPGDAIVYAPAVARWLLADAPRRIAVEAARVVSIGQGSVRLHDGSQRHAAAVVLAAGMHAARLCPELPLRARQGHLVITDRYPGSVRHQLVELGYVASTQAAASSAVAFNLQPRPTGQLLIGSTRQFDRDDAEPDPGVIARLLRRAIDFVPRLAALNAIRCWTGQRAATPDALPIIGAHPTRRGLWLAVGHEGLGVTLAPGSAALLAALITGGEASLPAQPYAATRFAALAA